MLLVSILACSLPGRNVDDPFSNLIPDLTGTAFYEAQLTPLTTLQPASTATLPPAPTWSASPVIPTETITPTTMQTSIPATSSIQARHGNLIQAIYQPTPLLIDGNLDDWSSSSYMVNNVVYGSDSWTGTNDLSGSLRVSWDDIYLYLAVEVTDDVFVQTATGENIFKGDSLEILMDTNLQADLQVAKLSPDDFQLGITAGSPSPGQSVEAYLWFPSSISGNRSAVKIGAQKTGSGYQVEAAVPWNVFEITPDSGDHFGFALSISDDDSPGQAAQQTMVSTVPNRYLTDPTSWGDLVLIK